MKGFTAASLLVAASLAILFIAGYILTAFASVSLSTNLAGIQANATFNTNQSVDFNLTISLNNITNINTPVQAIDINISEAGFVNITAENLRCPNNGTAWTNTSLLSNTILRCANTTGNTLTGNVQIRIVSVTARNSPGTPSFNVSAKSNGSMLVENSTLVTVTILELQASSSVNDTTSRIHEQRSYNFTVTNNATDPDNFDTIDEIRIGYSGAGFTDPGSTNITCPKIPATTGVAWDLGNDSAGNFVRCSKPTGTGSALGKGSSTNLVIDRWGASPTAGTKRFVIIVNGTNANGTYTVANQSSPNAVVNGTINITGTSRLPSTVAANATNVTLMLYNFSTVGEQFNVSVIKVTLSGTALAGDIDGVRLVNDTDNDGVLDTGDSPVFNASALTSARQYEFLGISFIVNQNQTLLLVANISGAATAGRTARFNINASGDVNSLGGSSGANVTEENSTSLQSAQATVHGYLTVTGFSRAPATKAINTANLLMGYLELNATGEGMNITLFNVTRTGTGITDSDVPLLRLFNDTNANAAFDDGTDAQLGAALNASSSGQYTFSGFQYNVSTSAINRLLIVVNISAATAGRTFSFGLNRTGDLQAVGATTAENFTATANISFSSAQTGTTNIHGTVAVTGTNVVASSVSVNTAGVSVIRYNISASGEGANITVINVTRGGNATDGQGILNVSVYNDTDLSGTFNSGDGALGTVGLNASSYMFSGLSYNIPSGGTKSIFVVASSNDTADRTFNVAINGTGSLSVIGQTTGENLTGSTNVTLTSVQSSTSEILSLAVTGTSMAPATKAVNSANITAMRLNFTATGEGMNISVIRISRNESAADADLTNVRLINDTDLSGTFDASDGQIGPTVNATSNGEYIFGGLSFNIPSGGTKSLIVVANTTTGTAGRTYRFNVNDSSFINTISQTTALNVTETLTTPVSARTTIHGTLTVTGTSVIAANVEVNSTNVTVIRYNFTSVGEGFNITELNITRAGSAVDADLPLLTVYTDTDGSGTFNAGDARLGAFMNASSSGVYKFVANFSFNASTTGVNTLFLVTNISATATTGGHTFNFTFGGRGDMHARGAVTGENITGSTNMTLTTVESSTAKIFGTLSVTTADLTPSTANDGQLNVPILSLTFTATGENVNLTQLNLTLNNTNNNDVSLVKIFNDTDGTGTLAAATDTLLATGGPRVGNLTRFLLNFSLPTSNSSVFIVAYDINTSGAGGNRVDGYVNAQGDIIVTGNASGQSINTAGSYPLNPASDTQITDLVATATLDFTSTTITATDNYNFTVENTGGEAINSIMLDYTASAYLDIANLNTVTCPRIAGANWTRTVNNATNTINCTSPGGANDLDVGSKANLTVNSFVAPTSVGIKTFIIQVRGVSGGFFNATTNGVTVSGLLNVTGNNAIASTIVVNSRNVSVIRYNLSASGEQMNVSVIRLTRAGTSRESDIVSIKLFNDTDIDGTYTATTDTTQIGATQTANTTASQYVFTGFQWNITTGLNQSVFAVVEVGNASTTLARTIILNINATGDLNVVGATTAVNITENLTGTASTASTIFGNLTVTGSNLVNSTVVIGTENAVMRLNFTSLGEGANLTMINVSVIGSATEANLTNVRIINDTNGNGIFDSASDTTIGYQLNTTTQAAFKFATTFQFNFTTSGVNTLFVVANISSAAGTPGKTFNLSVAGAADINAVGAASATNFTEVLVTTTSGQASVTGGTLSVTGTSLAATLVSVGQHNFTVIRYNFTRSGENINISVINVTRSGSATDSDIDYVSLVNDTNGDGLLSAADVRLGAALNASSQSGVYTFNGLTFDVQLGRVNTIFLVVNVTSGATGGRTLNFTINATGDINAIGASTAVNITGNTNITFSTAQSNTATVHGKLTATGKTLAPATAAVGSANITVLQINFSSTGEGFNISLINLTVNGSSTEANLTNARLFVDTDATGTFSVANDVQLGSAVASASGKQLVLTGFQFNVTTGAVNNTIFVVVNTSAAVGAGGTRFTISLNKTGDIQAVAAVSNKNMTADANTTLTSTESVSTVVSGQLRITGKVVNADFGTISSSGFTVLMLNFTPLGEGANITVLNLTRTGTVADVDGIYNVSVYNDTDLSGTFNSGDTSIGTVGLNTTASGQYIFRNLAFNVSTSGKTVFVVAAINSSSTIGGKTFNVSLVSSGDISAIGSATGENLTGSSNVTLTTTQSNTTKIYGTLALTSATTVNSSSAVNIAQLTVVRYNFTATGEAMNVTVVKVTKSGSANDTDVVNVRLFNDTNLDGVYNSGDVQVGSSQSSTTAGQYVFAGVNFNITTSPVTLLVVVNTSANSAGKTLLFNINATSDIDSLGGVSAFNITETNSTTLRSTQTAVFGSITITGLSMVGGQGSDAPGCIVNSRRCLASNEANVAVARLNLTATGEGFNITVIKLTRNGSSTLSDDHIENVRLVNDTNGNGAYDSGSDTTIGSAQSISAGSVYSFSGFQYNVSTTGVNTLFVVLNTTEKAGWDPQVYFNLSLLATGNIDTIGALSSENVTETLTSVHMNTSRITVGGWFNNTKVLVAGWNTDFFIPQQTVIETTGRNATTTGNFNWTTMLDSLGSSWTHMYYNINGSANGWVLATRTDFAGSTLQHVNNTNSNPYFINMTGANRFEL